MRYNYTTIKQLTADNPGSTIKDYLALAPQNDPFYFGTPADCANGEWFAEIYRRAGFSVDNAPHLRRVHYWTVSQKTPVLMPPKKGASNGLPYENTETCWDFLISASKAARYLGLVPFEGIRDNKNPAAHQHAEYSTEAPSAFSSVPELDNIKPIIEGIAIEDAQPYHLELWCEKSTMNGVLTPVCEEYNVNLVTFEGEVSITSVFVGLMNRIADSGYKPVRIFYISDFDPAGQSIPLAMARKLEYMLRNGAHPVDARVIILALTLEQVKKYRLPRTPIKETELRAGKFEASFGTGAVELDALEALYPNELAQIVDEAISPYYSVEAHEEVVRQYRALQRAITARADAIKAKYAAQIAALKPMLAELDAISVDANEYTVERFNPHVSEGDDCLFDSERGYEEQLVSYRRHKAGR